MTGIEAAPAAMELREASAPRPVTGVKSSFGEEAEAPPAEPVSVLAVLADATFAEQNAAAAAAAAAARRKTMHRNQRVAIGLQDCAAVSPGRAPQDLHLRRRCL
mmetsp:Transcript_43594/g.94993  ORF Transcript_43594/g.94993 Transcript_43594/m.94993 type:complete len:104 (+) Transcript_43594:777-1088(+)